MSMRIYVVTVPGGKRITLDVEPSDTIAAVKQKLQLLGGGHPRERR